VIVNIVNLFFNFPVLNVELWYLLSRHLDQKTAKWPFRS